MHPPIIATLELIEAHLRAQGQAAQFTYHGVLGGPDASVIVCKRAELVVRQLDGRTELAALVETAEAATVALSALEGLDVPRDHVDALAAFRRALTATRDRWPGLEREFPDAALAELLRDHPRAHPLIGHTIDPLTGGLHPAYVAVCRGRHPLFAWWSKATGFHVPRTATTLSSTRGNPLDWLSGADLITLPCELLQCVDLISLPDCDVGCDPGCL